MTDPSTRPAPPAGGVERPTIVGLFHDPWQREPSGRFARRWFRAQRFKANPRSEADMRSSFAAQWPQGRFLVADRQSLPGLLREADTVVKLYPDATGMRLGWFDRAVSRHAMPDASTMVLNGRGRRYAWDGKVRRRLGVRRFLEATMMVECAALVAFLLLTPFLLIWDLVRGRR